MPAALYQRSLGIPVPFASACHMTRRAPQVQWRGKACLRRSWVSRRCNQASTTVQCNVAWLPSLELWSCVRIWRTWRCSAPCYRICPGPMGNDPRQRRAAQHFSTSFWVILRYIARPGTVANCLRSRCGAQSRVESERVLLHIVRFSTSAACVEERPYARHSDTVALRVFVSRTAFTCGRRCDSSQPKSSSPEPSRRRGSLARQRL